MIDAMLRRFVKRSEEVHDPEVRQAYGMFSGGVGIFLNLLLFLGKTFAGLVTGSIAITADAFNNLSDAGSSVVTLIGFKMAGQKADKDHPFGHGRIEYLAGLLVSMAIVLVGVELAKSSVEKILHPETVDFSPLSVGILVAAICVKLWMFWFNRTLSSRIDSAAMAATAADSLTDSVATGAVLLGTLAGGLLDWKIDGWVGILVALFILYTGFSSARDTLNPLLGSAPDPELVKEIEKTVLSHPEVVGVHDLIIHDYGPGRSMMSLHAEVAQNGDMLRLHDVIDNIERELGAKFSTVAVIHMDPIATDDPKVQALRSQVAELVKQVSDGATIHDFRITPGPDHTNLIFDLMLPYGLAFTDEAAVAEVERLIRDRIGKSLYCVIEVDHFYA